MQRSLFLFICVALWAPSAGALDQLVDDFEDYLDDFDLSIEWQYSKAGGPDGLFYFLNDTMNPPDGNYCMGIASRYAREMVVQQVTAMDPRISTRLGTIFRDYILDLRGSQSR